MDLIDTLFAPLDWLATSPAGQWVMLLGSPSILAWIVYRRVQAWRLAQAFARQHGFTPKPSQSTMRLALALEKVIAVHVTGVWDGLQVEVYDDLSGRVRLTVFAERELTPGSTPVSLTKWSPVPPPEELQSLRFIQASGWTLTLRVSGSAEDLPRYLTAAVGYARALSSPQVGTGARSRQG